MNIAGTDSKGRLEEAGWYKGERTRDMTVPIDLSEITHHSVGSYVRWLWRSLSPFPPLGLRHNAMPGTGMLAAARTLAFASQVSLWWGNTGCRFVG